MRLFFFLSLFFAHSAYSMTQSEAYAACYSVIAQDKYSVANNPDHPPFCSSDENRVFANARDYWTYGNYYINAGAWQYDNRDTSGCNQTVVNIDTDISLTNTGAVASRGGAVKKPINFKNIAGIIGAGAIGGAVGGVPGMIAGGLISLASTALEAYLTKPTEITQNCTISVFNNYPDTKSVSTSNPTVAQVESAVTTTTPEQLKTILDGLTDAQFDCVTGGSCDGIPLVTDSAGTGDGSTPPPSGGTGNTGGTGDGSTPPPSDGTGGTGDGSTPPPPSDGIDLTTVEKNTADTVTGVNGILAALLAFFGDDDYDTTAADNAEQTVSDTAKNSAVNELNKNNGFFSAVTLNDSADWLPALPDSSSSCYGTLDISYTSAFFGQLIKFDYHESPCDKLADFRTLLYWFFYVTTSFTVVKIVFRTGG